MKPRARRPLRTGRAAAVLAASVLATALPATAARATGAHAPVVPLRVATYNIHAGTGEDQVFDLDRTAAALRDLRADVIGLQEVDVHWGARSEFADEARALAEKLRMRVFFAPIYDLEPAAGTTERRRYGVAVLSRHRVLAAENHEITRLSTQTPDPVPAPAPGFAEVVLDVRGARVHVYTTHLDYRADPSIREAQVADMLGVLAADRGPKVLVGDFNAEATALELAPLWQRLRDAAPAPAPPIRRANRSSASTWSPSHRTSGSPVPAPWPRRPPTTGPWSRI
ncbi:endonuclease/exonuclease/phosphatase family protein [Streptomyces sp. KM77-8]|uniref:Endonuclease/exonuclease/phosphatase family protein n=1 Tax=Streptomyces haneummycinicus TaxID=3074435 RepID=A0AAT9HKU7_9ACTN